MVDGNQELSKFNKKRMKLFDEFKLRFDRPDWSRDPELGLVDTILEQHSHLIYLLREDIARGEKKAYLEEKIPPVWSRSSGLPYIKR